MLLLIRTSAAATNRMTHAPLSTNLPERAWELSAQEQNTFNENFIRELYWERTQLSGQPATGLAIGLKAQEAGAA